MCARNYHDKGQTIAIIRPSVALVLWRLLVGLFLLDTAYAVVLMLAISEMIPINTNSQILYGTLWLLHTAKFILLAVMVLRLGLRWAGTTVLLVGDHLYIDQGVVKESERVYELAQLQEVKVHQSPLGRVLNFGDITLVLGSRSFAETVQLNGVADPAKHASYFMEFLEPA